MKRYVFYCVLGVGIFSAILMQTCDHAGAAIGEGMDAPPVVKSQFANWDAVMRAQAKDATCLMRAVEIYAPQPITDRIESYTCPMVAKEDKVQALKKSKRDLRSRTFPADDPVIAAINKRIEDLGGDTE
jgi:hypothetical protein